MEAIETASQKKGEEKVNLALLTDGLRAEREQGITIEIENKVVQKIACDSYEPEYGARPLGRELRRQIENPLAAKLLQDNFKNKKNISIKLSTSKKNEILFKPS